MKKMDRSLLENKIIDIHTHSMGMDLHNLHSGKYPVTQNVLDLSKIIADNRINYAVTFPMPTTIYYNPNSIRNKGVFEESGFSDYPYQYENYALCNIIKELQLSNIMPFVSVSTQAKLQEQIEGIYKLHETFGVYGIKYHAAAERMAVDNPKFEPFVKLAEDLDIPILVHSALSPDAHPDHVLNLAKQYPAIRLCIAHCARFHKPTLERIRSGKIKNVFVDTAPFIRLCDMSLTSSNIDLDDVLKLDFDNPHIALKEFAEYLPDNVLWGTDIPWQNYRNSVGKIITYTDETNILEKLEDEIVKKIMENQLDFLFGLT